MNNIFFTKKTFRTLLSLSLLIATFALLVSFIRPLETQSSSTSLNLSGYAWSDTIGWISLAGVSANISNTSNSYKPITGWGWSDNVGWIQFGGLSGFPTATTSGNAAVYSPTNRLTGWAKAVAGDVVSTPITTYGTSTYATAGTVDFYVPDGVTSITVKAWGAGGGSGASDGGTGVGGTGGGGGFARMNTIAVTPGETLSIRVGGGGGGGPSTHGGGGGGGYSGVFRSATPLVIAGGGGGGGSSRNSTDLWGGAGGAGGGTNGGNGSIGISAYGSTPPDPDVSPGYGGTQTAGGTATNTTLTHQNTGIAGASLAGGMGAANQDDVFGGGGTAGTNGGAAGGPVALVSWGGSGGGGGGGYYGGAGGAGGFTSPAGAGGGAGGGSGYISGVGTLTSGSGATPANTGDSAYVSGVGVGGPNSTWNIANATYLQNKSISAQDTFSRAVFFRSDGLRMYTTGALAAEVNEYTLSTAWNVTTATYSRNEIVSAQNDQPDGLFIDSTGTRMYLTGLTGDEINQYTLTTAWDVSTSLFVRTIVVTAQSPVPTGIFFNPTGSKMFVVSTNQQEVNEYTLSTPWEINTAVYAQGFSFSAQTLSPRAPYFSPDGLRLYVTGNNANSEVNQYALTSAWDIGTASFVRDLNVGAQDTASEGIFFKPDGSKMYLIGNINDRVNEYDLTGSGEAGTPGLVEITYSATTNTSANGWDGWISLSCTNTNSCATSNYGVSVDGAGGMSSYAWGSDVVGWTSFSGASMEVCPASGTRTCTAPNTSQLTNQWCELVDTTCTFGCDVSTGACFGALTTPVGSLIITPLLVRNGSSAAGSFTITNMTPTSCTVTGGSDSFPFAAVASGNFTTMPITNEVTYTLRCADSAGTIVTVDTEKVRALPKVNEG